MKKWVLAVSFILMTVTLTCGSFPSAAAANTPAASDPTSPPVAVIPVHQEIESGLESFLNRAFKEANKEGAAWIVLDINTLGGSISDAESIGELIRQSPIQTAAFVHGKAASAGSYISLNADKIVMSPGSSIGAAAVVDPTGRLIKDPKIIAHWSSEMASAAEMHGRNRKIAEGMVDQTLTVPMPQINRTKEPGAIISLTAQEALKVGYADSIQSNLNGVLAYIKAQGHPILYINPTPAERLARFLVKPWVMTILFMIGIAGIAIEFLMPGVTLPGVLGVLAFALYFFGHYVAGFAGIEDIVLFIIGLLLMLAEIFVPSFGIIGITGIICLVLGVVLAAYNTTRALENLGIAFVVAVAVVLITARVFKHKGVWNRFILQYQLTTDQGYVSSPSFNKLQGKTGITVTPLRPSGKVMIDGERIDVVTSGEFIPANTEIVVGKIDGGRIIVREVEEIHR